MPNSYRFAILAVMLTALAIVACRQEPAEVPAKPTEIVLVSTDSVSKDPADARWQQAPPFDAELILQDMVDPRLMTPSIKRVRVQAMADANRIALRLQWDDSTVNDINDPAKFTDACAVQMPAIIEANVPAPQMGEPGRPVEITYWRAQWQATVDGRKDDISALYPNITVDHYPFEAASLEPGSPPQKAMQARYAPARALGNKLAGPRKTPVQDLIAEGPGTLTPASTSNSDGHGQRTESGWVVVLTRPLPQGFTKEKEIDAHVAFAVWEGSKSESGSRKMRSVWIPLKWQQNK